MKETEDGLEESKEEPKQKSLLDKITKKLNKLNYYVKECDDGNRRFLQCDTDDTFKFVDQKHYDLLGDML